MTAAPPRPTAAVDAAPIDARRRWLPPTVMLLATLIGTLLPVIRNRRFYFWDDTAGVAVGVWQRIPEAILSGHLPFLESDMWRGGNLIAEAATGMWNPVILGLMLGTHPIDDVAVAITAAKIALFLITAGGLYLLARGFHANAWMSAVVGVALPLSGWSIFMDGSSWINGTAIMAFTPWAWWALRRCYLRGFRPWDIVVAIVLAYLVPSTGNPYGFLSLALVFVALGVEALFNHRPRALWWLVPIGVASVLLVVIDYLPFLLTSAYGVRADSGIGNDEFLAVNVSDLLGMSTPTHHPYIKMFGNNPMSFPGVYLAWFILPLLPWLRWRGFAQGWRRLSGVIAFGAIFLLFALGPSQFGMFRWPARLIPFVFTALLILFAVIASRGINRTRFFVRALMSAGVILFGAWTAYSDVPAAWKWHGLVTVFVLGGIVVIVRWTGFTPRGALVMIVGSVVFLAPQLILESGNMNVADYDMPSSRSELKKTFADRSDGLVVQVFDVQKLVSENPAETRWQDLLAGNMPSVAGVESTTAYTGIGFNAFDNALCMTYNGGTCPAAWYALWEKPTGSDHVLADLLGARYVVLQNGFVDHPRTPAGWSVQKRTDIVTVYARDAAPAHQGTITVTGDGVQASDDVRTGPDSEQALISTTDGDRRITFGRIAWPGYELKIDGKPVATKIGPAGLLTAQLPAGLNDARMTLSFTPPGLWIGVAAAALGVILVSVLLVFASRRRKLAEPDAPPAGDA